MQMVSAFKALNTQDVYGILNSWEMEILLLLVLMALQGYGQQILTGSAVMRNLQLIQILFLNTHLAGWHLLVHNLFPSLLQGFVISYRIEYLLILIPVDHGLCTFTNDTIMRIVILFLKTGSLALFSHHLI